MDEKRKVAKITVGQQHVSKLPLNTEVKLQRALTAEQKQVLAEVWRSCSTRSFVVAGWWNAGHLQLSFVEHPSSGQAQPTEQELNWYGRLARVFFLTKLVSDINNEWVCIVERHTGHMHSVCIGKKSISSLQVALQSMKKIASMTQELDREEIKAALKDDE